MNKIMTEREYYESAILNMMSNKKMVHLSFYSFILAKCNVTFDNRIETLGVSFSGTSYNLIIGRKFKEWTLDERIAVLIHETRHILGQHVFRKGSRDHKMFNIACDVAINQTIVNLPKGKPDPKTGEMVGGALFPETFKFPENLDSENYYELLKQKQEDQEKEKQEHQDENGEPDDCDSCGGSGEQEDENGDSEPCDDCEGSGKEPGGWKPSDGTPDLTKQKEITIDVHEWNATEAEQELGKSIAEQMVKDAVEMTTKNRGTLPGDLSDIMSLLRRKPVISWKKELKRVLASKTGKRVETIKRKNRRFPHRADLRGKRNTVDKHEVVVCLDTSGSMSNADCIMGLSEIHNLVKATGKALKVIQVDTKIQGIVEYDKNIKTFNRMGYGGTTMYHGVDYIMEQRMKPDLVIYISDMYTESVEESSWNKWNKTKTPTLWLSTSGSIPEWNGYKKHKVIDINKM